MPFHRVVRITEGVSATANKVSEEEKLRKLCGYSVNAVRLPDINRRSLRHSERRERGGAGQESGGVLVNEPE